MADYIELPLTADATALSDLGKDYLSANIDGWTPRPGNVESILLEANGQIAAEIVDQVAQVPPIIFAYFGDWLLGISIHDAQPATASVDFTFNAGAVVTVPAGSLISAPNPDGDSYAFQTDADVRSDTTPYTTTVTALEAGSAANGCQGACELIDMIADVASVTMSVVAANGEDLEEADDYLDRLSDALTILAPRPILPADFATMARQIEGVGRALAIDLYQPGTNDNITAGQPGGPLTVEGTPVNSGAGLSNVARCVTLGITADAGQPPTQALMHNVWTVVDAAREVNFLAYVIAPRYSVVDVTATVVRFPGYTDAEVQAAAVEMLTQWLDPAGWGSDTQGEEATWTLQKYARLYEAVDWLNRAGGVNYVTAVTLGLGGGAQSAVDVALPGTIPLPLVGALVVNVTPPS